MDAKTLRLAQKLGMQQTVCQACKQPTLFIFNDKRNNMPKTCGMMQCLEKTDDPMGKR
jgi:hypothetical protein